MDLHPAAELAGEGSGSRHDAWQRAFDKGRVKPGNRSLRLKVRDLRAEVGPDWLQINFTLGRGAFATSVLREIFSYQVGK
jgi:tRNA pseudouridine13 synthase